MRRLLRMGLAMAGISSVACQPAPPPQQTSGMTFPRIVDLTYSFDEQTLYWSAAEKFVHTPMSVGQTEAGYWYSSYNFSASEHGGTHMDAPIHFAEGRQSVDEIPIARHIGPGVKISVAEKAAADPDCRISADDIRSWESTHGEIPSGAVVLIHTGWGQYWGDRLKYFGSAASDDTAERHFPGIASDAAEMLAKERRIAMVGIDTASLDYGPSKDFIAHQILNGANIAGLENIANLDQLPETGFLLLALPMKIAGGSGAPARVVALLQP